jgi:hypothetical protein
MHAVHGQQWEFQPTFSVQASYEDNITLDPERSESGLGSSLRAAARALRSTEANSLVLSAGLSLNEFADNSDLSNTTALIAADWSRQTPRGQFRLNQSLTTQSTLTSEVATTGFTDVNRQQYRINIQPGWSYRLDEYSSLNLGASYEDVFYDDVEDTSLNNFRSGSLSLSIGRRLSERFALNLSSSYGLFQSQGDENDTENLSVQLGAEYQLSETFNVSALAGLRRTTAAFVDAQGRRVTEDSSGTTYSLTAQKQFAEGAALRALAARELTPSGASEVLDTTRLQLGYSYPVNERLRLSLASQAYRNRQPGEQGRRPFTRQGGAQGSGPSNGIDRDYADAKMGLSYQLFPTLSVNLDYTFRWQQNTDESGSASSNRLGLSLSWRGR